MHERPEQGIIFILSRMALINIFLKKSKDTVEVERLKAGLFKMCEEQFRQTENPIFVWIVLKYQAKDTSVPRWVQDYLAESATNLLHDILFEKNRYPKNHVTDSLKLDGNSFRKFKGQYRKESKAFDLEALLSGKKPIAGGPEEAFKILAEELQKYDGKIGEDALKSYFYNK